MQAEPRGYWTRVFNKAAQLLHEKPELSADGAYMLARAAVDQEGGQPPLLDSAPDLNLEP